MGGELEQSSVRSRRSDIGDGERLGDAEGEREGNCGDRDCEPWLPEAPLGERDFGERPCTEKLPADLKNLPKERSFWGRSRSMSTVSPTLNFTSALDIVFRRRIEPLWFLWVCSVTYMDRDWGNFWCSLLLGPLAPRRPKIFAFTWSRCCSRARLSTAFSAETDTPPPPAPRTLSSQPATLRQPSATMIKSEAKEFAVHTSCPATSSRRRATSATWRKSRFMPVLNPRTFRFELALMAFSMYSTSSASKDLSEPRDRGDSGP
mmetsp:Transcript_112651/g.323744  ORF Transcript_112651/g.323744 Transcript_112651/m.323744 type:complete len:262 (-) Transcript_112651:441-1226(-)